MKKFSMRPAMFAMALVLVGSFAFIRSVVPLPVEPLSSWNDGPAKQAILKFVANVTDEKSQDYVKPEARIAVFDNDGTLWVEQPLYTQIAFMFDRVKELVPEHPEWKTMHPFQAVLEDDQEKLAALGKLELLGIALATQTGMTAEQYKDSVSKWIATAKHPQLQRRYTELVYQPQLELIDFLKASGFKVFITSGGGVEFMRPWTEAVYGIPPERVIGSSVKTKFRIQDEKPVLVRTPVLDFINDEEGKPAGIYQRIGRRPILAFGNSDRDVPMIQYTTAGDGPRLGLFLHHTDADREFAYDRQSQSGKLDEGLELAKENGWIVVDMKRDWNTVFPAKNAEKPHN